MAKIARVLDTRALAMHPGFYSRPAEHCAGGMVIITKPRPNSSSRFTLDSKKGSRAAPLFAKLPYRFESAATTCASVRTTRTAKVVRSVLVQL
jgi:hypothetical protein